MIDSRGMPCPQPVLMAEEALIKIQEGSILILVDNEASTQNLSRFAKKNGFYSDVTKEGDYWRVKITKEYNCEIDMDKNQEPQKDILLIIATTTMGKDEALGKILMKSFFETIKVTKELPHTIFFMNTAIQITTRENEILPILKDLADMGVEIFTCGTCLKYFNKEGDLKVGYRGTSNHIVEGMKDFKKTVWIG